ncbi:aminotransferase class I/II-fold pyridoxal phosphate-dependent enzyme [Helicobacter baculiformis]|uniref:Aminotransferase class I/II-fold pyridoxal phosphate-dependent enzyme n=1 Tax=Helicobacter baculiformis TaxID=427351 RepID=A0A1M4NGR9_9HELI|nr:pyridoxal phosphate-dependent aminotransferase family protein [Helicobacter baculiformis]SFZ71420.1 OMP1060 [Helicobacter baculiformis]
MDTYSSELRALRRAGLYRERHLYPAHLHDFASNDYLGLSTHALLLEHAFEKVRSLTTHAPKASMLLNGYHPLHRELEEFLCARFGYEACLLVGSGFLGNVALIDALVRKNDILFMDAHYHASGQFLAKKLPNAHFFSHNNTLDLVQQLKNQRAQHPKGRIFIAIEGVYSMDGQVAPKEFYTIAQEYDAYLILDEAHSLGVLGRDLGGYLSYYHLKLTPRIIVLGTLSKAYGSYGAFIGASPQVVEFLCNRAKSVIYTTSLSLLDSALALVHLEHLYAHLSNYVSILEKMRVCCAQILGFSTPSNILTLPFERVQSLLNMHTSLLEAGFLCAPIRPPTVQKPLLRISLNVQPSHTLETLGALCTLLARQSFTCLRNGQILENS